MSGVKRYHFKGAAGSYVYSADYDALAHELSLSEAMCESLGESAVMVQPLRDEVADLRGKLAASKEAERVLQKQMGELWKNIEARDKQLAHLHGEIDTLCTAITARDKLLADAVGLMNEVSYYVGSSYSRASLELCQRFDAFLTTIEQDKENG